MLSCLITPLDQRNVGSAAHIWYLAATRDGGKVLFSEPIRDAMSEAAAFFRPVLRLNRTMAYLHDLLAGVAFFRIFLPRLPAEPIRQKTGNSAFIRFLNEKWLHLLYEQKFPSAAFLKSGRRKTRRSPSAGLIAAAIVRGVLPAEGATAIISWMTALLGGIPHSDPPHQGFRCDAKARWLHSAEAKQARPEGLYAMISLRHAI